MGGPPCRGGPPRQGGAKGVTHAQNTLNFRCTQLNLHRSHTAKSHLDAHSSSVQLIQEPPERTGGHLSMAHPRFEVFSEAHKTGGPRPRAAIRVAKNLAAAQLVQFTSRDQVACNIKGRDHDFIMASIYCDINGPAVTGHMTALVQHCQNKCIPLIMGLDSNSHSTLWGPTQNKRGGDLEDFINANDLVVLNDGLRPTWSQNNKTSYIDITVINRYAAEKFYGENWEVQEGESFSDHKLITFDIIPPLVTQREVRDMKNIDWHRFQVSIDRELEGVDPDRSQNI